MKKDSILFEKNSDLPPCRVCKKRNAFSGKYLRNVINRNFFIRKGEKL